MGELFLVENTKLKCDKGNSVSNLKVTSQSFNRIGDQLQATEEDKKPNENIFPFGVCSITQKPCVPNTINWGNTVTWSTINNMASLTEKSELKCTLGGIIKPQEIGQTFHRINNEPISQAETNNLEDDNGNEDQDTQILFNDYHLFRNGQIKLVKDRNNSFDRLFASDKNNNIDRSKSIDVRKENGKSIISDLATGSIPDDTRYAYLSGRDGKKMFPLGVNRARTNNESAVAEIFIFVANNSDVEWGLAGYDIENTIIYALWTGHNEDRTPPSILYQGISKLSFRIHSHPGSTMTPSPINSANDGDYDSVSRINNIFHENRNYPYPRHFMYSKQGKHLWEYNYTTEGDKHYYPGKPGVNRPMPVVSTINLKTLRK